MGYRILNPMPEGYGPRKGHEGHFNLDGRVVYYDPKEGEYWDPRTDFYLSHEEALDMYRLTSV